MNPIVNINNEDNTTSVYPPGFSLIFGIDMHLSLMRQRRARCPGHTVPKHPSHPFVRPLCASLVTPSGWDFP